ncbi:tRNA (adenosine(37)-N6)-dimethylallyltransferase MiaA [Wenyingzhuangia sp. IMCC45533]
MNYLITIVGPTAIGKTALSIKLAQHFKAEIISCDSRQFFKEMTIGTAVPEPEELAAAKHHFIQNKSINDDYSVGHFEREALKKLDDLYQNHPIAIMVGGSGLYVDAVLKGLDYFPEVAPEIRENLNKQLESEGLEILQKQLLTLDPESYKTIAIDNPKRVIRALEICIGSNHTYSSFKNKPKAVRNFTPIKIGLTANREVMYERINRRVDIMLEKGQLDEAKKLHASKHLNALQTVGYRELFDYLDGKIDIDFAVSEIKKNTRRFAKRQITWFKKDKETLWFDYQTPVQDIIATVDKILRKQK